jgi:hypothetical protein
VVVVVVVVSVGSLCVGGVGVGVGVSQVCDGDGQGGHGGGCQKGMGQIVRPSLRCDVSGRFGSTAPASSPDIYIYIYK